MKTNPFESMLSEMNHHNKQIREVTSKIMNDDTPSELIVQLDSILIDSERLIDALLFAEKSPEYLKINQHLLGTIKSCASEIAVNETDFYIHLVSDQEQ